MVEIRCFFKADIAASRFSFIPLDVSLFCKEKKKVGKVGKQSLVIIQKFDKLSRRL